MEPEAAFLEDAPPFRHIRPSSRTTSGTAMSSLRAAFTMPCHDVAAQDAPENIDEDARTCGSESMIETRRRRFPRWPRPRRQGCWLARLQLLDGVHRGHRKPGPVHQRTDGTAQPNIGGPLFGGGALQQIALFLSLKAAISGCRFSAVVSSSWRPSCQTAPSLPVPAG